MKRILRNRLSRSRGITIIELLIASVITGVIATAGFNFYVHMHDSTYAQQDVIDAHLICRNTLLELKKSFRMAGYKVGTHDAYDLGADTFTVYYQDAQPIDTVMFFLTEFSDSDYSLMKDLPVGTRLYKLYKKVNSGAPAIFSDYLLSLQIRAIDSKNISIDIVALTANPDAEWKYNNGYRTCTLQENVKMRNAA